MNINYFRHNLLRHMLVISVVGIFAGYSFMVGEMLKSRTFDFPFHFNGHSVTYPDSVPISYNDPSKPWRYDFSNYLDGSLPTDIWNFEVGNKAADANNEAETYTGRLQNVRVENGALIIQAHKENLNGRQYTSGRINTKNKVQFGNGALEIEALLPSAPGTWPAIWLLPTSSKYKPGDFNISKNDRYRWSVNGEIDILEALGTDHGLNHPHLHTYNELQLPPKLINVPINDAYTQYHLYGIIKTSDKITFTVDGEPNYSVDRYGSNALDWPFDQNYYLIINVAVGGWEEYISPNFSNEPRVMKIKSINYKPF